MELDQMARRPRQFAPPTADERAALVPVTAQMRLDVVANIEENRPVPVYFQSTYFMEAFCSDFNEMAIDPIPDCKPEEAVLVRRKRGAGGYGLVWVKAVAKQKAVRSAMVNHIVTAYGIDPIDLAPVDADHVVNRASLAAFPDAWVAVMPVFYEVNSRTGFLFEKGLVIDPVPWKIFANPLHLFKMLSSTWPRTLSEYKLALREVHGQHLVPGLTIAIHNYIVGAFPFAADVSLADIGAA